MAAITAIGLLAFATRNAQGVLLKITIKVTATTQNEPTTSKGVTTYTTTKTTVGTRDVLTTLATIEEVIVPDSSTLVYDTTAVDTNVFTIRNHDGGIIKDVTSRFKFSRGEGTITSGTINDTIGSKSSIKDTFVGTFTFQPDNGNDFTIVGLAKDEREQSTAKTNQIKMNESFSLPGSGPGHVGGVDAIVNGKVSGLWQTTTAVLATNAAPQSGFGGVILGSVSSTMVTTGPPPVPFPVTVAAP